MKTYWTILSLPWFSVYLYKVSESDKEFHNHLWSFISIILKGRCTDLNVISHSPRKFKVTRRKFLNIKKYSSSEYHCIKITKPVYVLCITGKINNTPNILKFKSRQ